MNYAYVWIVVSLAGLGTLAGIFVFSRFIAWDWLRTMVRCLSMVILLVPAGIQVADGYYAPAFIVALFEGLFKREGNPWPALQIIGVGCLAVCILLGVVQAWRLYQSRGRRPANHSANQTTDT